MSSAVSFNPETTLGACELGVLVSYILFGVTTTQVYIYYHRFPDDSLNLKALVAFVWVCEAVHAVCLGHMLYTYTISDYGHPERIAGAFPKSLIMIPFLTGILAVCVHGFFSIRIYAFTKQLYIPCLIWVMTFLQMLGRTVLFGTALRMVSAISYELKWAWLVTSVWCVSAATDLVITATLVAVLIRQRASTQKRTAAVVDRLILWTIETGMLTSASAIGSLVCFVTMEGNCTLARTTAGMPTEFMSTVIYLAFFVVEARVFSNSLLATLNSRVTLRAMNEVSSTPAIELPTSVQMSRVIQVMRNADSNHASSYKTASVEPC
ncbi:hypothetical protein B0H19DRAFT_663997 [Mycena capillaripes]|nr:hypothetical protein B0H19DRAFT_663997 [Mycena capillaripes]